MRAILDNNLSWRLAAALNVLVDAEGHEVRHLTEKFPSNAPDIEWITALGKEGGWVIISADRRIHKNHHEREVWWQSGLTVFFLGKAWRRIANMERAWRLIRWWPRIIEQAELVQPGAAFEIPIQPSHGRFRQLKT